jgi:hypothetical protein
MAEYDELAEEIDNLRNEVERLREIVSALFQIVVENNDIDFDTDQRTPKDFSPYN